MIRSIRTTLLGVGIAAALAAQPQSWNPKAAGGYLDQRIAWWMTWPTAARDHETFCISCHTAAPYAMSRALLRADLGEQNRSGGEEKLLANVTKRVRMWKEVEPFYPDEKRGKPKTAESRGTESIFNALILARYDAAKSKSSKVNDDTRLAFDNMWAEQIKTGDDAGAWAWLQFHNSPWEGDSQFYGATLAAIAVGTAGDDYLATPGIQAGLDSLRGYLAKQRDSQALINRVMLVWASTKVGGLLTSAQQKSILGEAIGKQQADGGFSLSTLVGGWKRADGTPLESASDGYATGLMAFVMRQAGTPHDDVALTRALAWLNRNQQPDGRWLAWSLNKQRDLSSDIGRFMSDAATAYAILALKSGD